MLVPDATHEPRVARDVGVNRELARRHGEPSTAARCASGIALRLCWRCAEEGENLVDTRFISMAGVDDERWYAVLAEFVRVPHGVQIS